MPHFSSEEDGHSSEGVDIPTAKRLRGRAQKWELFKEFADVPSFQAWMENQQQKDGLVKSNISKGEVAEKRVYQCKAKRTHNCEYKLRADYHRGETGVEVWWNGIAHQHLNSVSVDAATKAAIQQYLTDGLKAS